MKTHHKHCVAAALAVALIAPYLSLPASAARMRASLPRAAAPVARAYQDPQTQRIADRDRAENGITVTEPHVYDDAQLQQRLEELEARLATLQVIDQKTLADRIGTLSGASQQISSFALNAQGPSVPGVTTTSKLPTEATTVTTAAGATSSGIMTVSNLGTNDVTTTRSAFSPPTATPPVPTTTLPSSFSVSSSDTLNEMTQLTAEINGLRLLLSGDLSSHFIRGGPSLGNQMTKFKTTLGFDISVKPDERYKDAVAVVEVEVENVCETISNEPPAITALLPREKTYNVAAITDKSTSIGGGVATQILGVSGSLLRGRKTYYVVQDQDTVALTFTPENSVTTCTENGKHTPRKVGFLWEFRPVLGRRFVSIADKTTFVQLAFAVPPAAGDGQIGKVTVRSYWRGYDRKTGVHKRIIDGSLREHFLAPYDIPRYQLAVSPNAFNFGNSIEDLGGGQILVKLPGRFLPGTNVRIGPTTLAEGPRLRHTYSGITFAASLADLVTNRVFVVAHDGTEIPLVFNQTQCSNEKGKQLSILSQPVIATVDDTNSRVIVAVNHPEWAKVKPEDWLSTMPPIIFVVGQHAFGFPDAPLQRIGPGDAYLTFIAPTAWLVSSPQLIVQTLFPQEGCMASARLAPLQPPSQTERLALLEQGEKEVKFLLYGSRLSGLKVLAPDKGVTVSSIGNPADDDRLLQIEVKADQLKTNKQLFVQRPGEPPFLIPFPPLEAPKKPDPPKAHERVTLHANEAVIDGVSAKDLKDVSDGGVTFRKKTVLFEPVGDNSIRLLNLDEHGAGVTAETGTRTVTLQFKSGAKPVQVDLEVVTTKVETVPK